jgi:hypothetical protein
MKMDLNDIGCKVMGWVLLTQDRIKWRASDYIIAGN